MKFLSAFEIPLPADEAWKLLLDVPAIAPCVPGAALTDDLGDGRYRGTATVKIGPVELTFSGEAAIGAIDAAARTAAVTAKGMDKKGRGNAAAKVDFALTPLAGNGTRVEVKTDLQLTGSVAQYGRAEGLVKSVADEITRQFAGNLKAKFAALQSDQAAVAPTAAPAAKNTLSAFALLVGILKSFIRRITGRQAPN